MRNAPFVAVNTLTVTDSKGTHQVAGKVARNSAGSNYMEDWNIDTNQPYEILIYDVPGKRLIILEVDKKLYRINDMPILRAYDLPPTWIAQQINQSLDDKPIQEVRNGLTYVTKGIGKREIDGNAAVGKLLTAHKSGSGPSAIDSTTEIWTSPDLQITLMTKGHDTVKGSDILQSLSQIQRVEPDAALFQIPADYQRDPINAQGAAAAQGTQK